MLKRGSSEHGKWDVGLSCDMEKKQGDVNFN